MKPLLFATVLTSAFVLLSSCASNDGEFTLVNRASEGISRASVKICGQTFDLTELLPGRSVSRSYRVKGGCHFTIEVQFQSGRKLNEDNLGYVTSGANFKDEFTVTDSQIVMSGSQIN